MLYSISIDINIDSLITLYTYFIANQNSVIVYLLMYLFPDLMTYLEIFIVFLPIFVNLLYQVYLLSIFIILFIYPCYLCPLTCIFTTLIKLPINFLTILIHLLMSQSKFITPRIDPHSTHLNHLEQHRQQSADLKNSQQILLSYYSFY